MIYLYYVLLLYNSSRFYVQYPSFSCGILSNFTAVAVASWGCGGAVHFIINFINNKTY